MNIQWYPGHMTKTRRQIEADLGQVDMVAEIVDARIPISSRNPDIDAIVGAKPRLVVLNRADQADPAGNRFWTKAFQDQGFAVLETDSKTGKGVSRFSEVSRVLLKEQIQRWQARWAVPSGPWWWGCPTWGNPPLLTRWPTESLPRRGTGPV